MKHIAFILAGGMGSRVGGETPKQFLPLPDGRSVLEHSVDAFEQSHYIHEIVIVTHPDWIEETEQLVKRNPWTKVTHVISGGAERWESSWNGISLYLYEPNASLMKACPFRLLAQHYQLEKLHPNSHLYTSPNRIEDFPGRRFRVNDVLPVNKQTIKQISQLRQANIHLNDSNRVKDEYIGKFLSVCSDYIDINEQLRQANIHLNDSNRVKDEYIGKFLSVCSDYIDKLDNYRIKVNRKLKAGQQADVLRMTSSEQLKEEELKEFFDRFDDIFLRLFPTFIEDFNALLRPGEGIIPTEKNHLSTDLRIFALIRLGIEESSKIAEFLRYSPNSIYAYRARIKNKAAGNREEFEKLVKEIGIKG